MNTRRPQCASPDSNVAFSASRSWTSRAAFARYVAFPAGSARARPSAIVIAVVSTYTGSNQRCGSIAAAPPSPLCNTPRPADALIRTGWFGGRSAKKLWRESSRYPLYTNATELAIRAASPGVGSQSWGSTPGGTRAATEYRSPRLGAEDRKSTRLNSSHDQISYAVFCLKKKKNYSLVKHCIKQAK